MRTASLHHTLVYYDGPELFLARDKFGVSYVSLAVPKDQKVFYASVPLTSEDVSALFGGESRLREIIVRNALEAWYLSDPLLDGFDQFNLSLQDETFPENFLPSAEFDLAHWLPEPSELAHLALSRGRPVVGIRVDPPEAHESGRIRTNTLAALLIEFQKLVRYAKRNIYNKTSVNQHDHSLDLSLNTLAFGQGSFRIYFESAGQPDLFGGNDVEVSLALINEILETPSNTDLVVERIRNVRGHFVSSLKRMLEILEVNETFIEIDWAKPGSTISQIKISRSAVKPLLERLNATEALSKELRRFEGQFLRVDVKSGSWRLKTLPEEDEFYGNCEQPHDLLAGVVIETGTYSIVCEEKIEENIVTGKEKHLLTLVEIKHIS
jgi:hypothetical protein